MRLSECLGDAGRCWAEKNSSVTEGKRKLDRIRQQNNEGEEEREAHPQCATVTESFLASKKGVVVGVSRE
jgi:hypothetical protein